MPLPSPPYDKDDNAGDDPAKEENYPHSNQKYLGKVSFAMRSVFVSDEEYYDDGEYYEDEHDSFSEYGDENDQKKSNMMTF